MSRTTTLAGLGVNAPPRVIQKDFPENADAAAMIALKGWSPRQAEAFMELAETSRAYACLYRSVAAFDKPSAGKLAAAA